MASLQNSRSTFNKLSTPKHVRIPMGTVGIIYPCTEKKFTDLNHKWTRTLPLWI